MRRTNTGASGSGPAERPFRRRPAERAIGLILIAAGAILGLWAAYWLLLGSAWAGLYSTEPEELYLLPFIGATPALLLAGLGYWLARPGPGWLRVALVAPALPALLVWSLSAWALLWTWSLPLHAPSRSATLVMSWQVHDQVPDRVVIRPPDCEHAWTVGPQAGLVDRLLRLDDASAPLTVLLVYDGEGRPIRGYPKRLADQALARQHISSGPFLNCLDVMMSKGSLR